CVFPIDVVAGLVKRHKTLPGKSLIGLYAPVETGDAAPRFLAVLDDSLPFFFVGNERPVLFAVGGDLQLVGVRVGKINASFSRSAESVFGARVALVGAAQGRNQFQHTIEIVLAYVESDVQRAAMPFRAVRQCCYRPNTEQLVMGELEKGFVVIFAHRSKAEGFGVKSLRAIQVSGF